jgi:hypothetical protein
LVAANEQLRKEIAERVRAEEALKRSEENFRSLIGPFATSIRLGWLDV